MIEIIFRFLFGAEGEELYSAFVLEVAESPVVMETVLCVAVVFALLLVVCFYQFIRSVFNRRK